MLRRTAIALLWFIAIALAHELIWSLTGSPRLIGPTLGTIAALFVFFDPLRQFHPSLRPEATSAPNERLPIKAGITAR